MAARRPVTTPRRSYEGSDEQINRQPPADDQLWNYVEVNDHTETLKAHADDIDSLLDRLLEEVQARSQAIRAAVDPLALDVDSLELDLSSLARVTDATNQRVSQIEQAGNKGRLTFETLAELVAYGAPPNADNELSELAEVWNDPITANIGVYGWTGSEWDRSEQITAASVDINRIAETQIPLVELILRLKERLRFMVEYTGTDDVVPAFLDEDGKRLMGFDAEDGTIVAEGIRSDSSMQQVVPVLEDEIGQLLLGATRDRGELLYDPAKPSVTRGLAKVGIYPDVDMDPVWAIVDDDLKILLSIDAAGYITIPSISTLPLTKASFSTESIVRANFDTAYNHFMFYGQSLSTGSAGQPALSVTPDADSVMFAGGVRPDTGEYGSFVALAESDDDAAPDGGSGKGETPLSSAAHRINMLMQGREHKLLMSTAGRGGYRIDQLVSTEDWYSHVTDQIAGGFNTAQALGKSYSLQAVAWLQGEANINGAEETRQSYAAKLETLISDINTYAKATTGQAWDALMISYQVNFRMTLNPKIALAQYDADKAEGNNIVVCCPTYQFPYSSDEVHMTNVGYMWMGAYFAKAYKSSVIDGRLWSPTKPIAFMRSGRIIEIKYHVPEGALQLNTVDIPAFTDYGFKCIDSADNQLAINALSVRGDTISLELASAPGGNIFVRYGLDYTNDSISCDRGAGGNVSDSSPDKVIINGTDYHLQNMSVCFEEELS